MRSPIRHGVDMRVATLAHRQHGIVARVQLLAMGLGSGAIDGRVAAGRLHPMHRGVYAVGHARLSEQARWLAAVLAAGPQAWLSHGSAAALWRILPSADGPVHLTVASGSHRGRPGLAVHRSSTLGRHETTRRMDVPVTKPARTLVDVADGLPVRQLQRALGEAYALRIVDRSELANATGAAGRRRGAHRLATLLNEHDLGFTLTRSALEERFLDLCTGANLPAPRVNAEVEGLVVDFLWPVRGLVRFTYRQVVRTPESVVATLRTLLAGTG